MKYITLILVTMVLLSCGAAVSTDFTEGTDFSKYKTYNYYPDLESGLSQLDDKRIKSALDSLMQARGFAKSSTPDFLINFFARQELRDSRSSIGIGVGGGGRNAAGGISGGIPIGGTYINQILTLDFVDTAADNLIWQAVSDGKFREKATPKQKDTYYFTVIEKVLKKYPPKVK